jgi:hypothetical protein
MKPDFKMLVTTCNLAATLVLLDSLSSERKPALSLVSGSSGLSLHSGLDLAGHGKESLFDVGGGLGRSFEELNSKAIGEFFALLCRNNTLARQIGLISH